MGLNPVDAHPPLLRGLLPRLLVIDDDEAMRFVLMQILEDEGFTNMKVSLKASDVHHAIDAYYLFSTQSNYPLHIGITEAGTAMTGARTNPATTVGNAPSIPAQTMMVRAAASVSRWASSR